jgi:hypothetical protein
MARRRFALEQGGPKELELRWGLWKRNFEVAVGGRSWRLDRPQLKAGATLELPNGSSLFVRWVPPRWYTAGERDRLLVERDGLPVPGSDGDPRVVGRRAGGLIVVFGLLRALFLTGELALGESSVGPIQPVVVLVAAAGLAMLVLGILALLGKRLPVVLAAGLLSMEMLAALAVGGFPNPLGLLIQILVIVNLVRAWKRMAPRERRPTLTEIFE